jgi:ABC-type polysaccharide/polyol phosphate export permease
MIGAGPYIRYKNGLQDLFAVPGDFRAISVMAWDDVTAKYKRTLLGPWWVALAHLVLMLGIGTLLGSVFKRPFMEYVVYVGLGLTLFTPVISALSDGPSIFLRYKSWILGSNYALASYVIRALMNVLVTMLHQAPAILLFCVLGKMKLHASMLLFFVGMPIMLLFSIGLMLCLAPLGVRFRDLTPATQAFTSLLIIMTPIYWDKGQLGAHNPVLLANPAYHLLQIVRAPLLGEYPTMLNWTVGGGSALALFLLGAVIFHRSYWRISVSL